MSNFIRFSPNIPDFALKISINRLIQLVAHQFLHDICTIHLYNNTLFTPVKKKLYSLREDNCRPSYM
jgi:hypothetical protein